MRTAKWLKAWMTVALATMLAGAVGAQEYATARGNNARNGTNGAPSTMFPGQTKLRWWHPNQLDANAKVFSVVDDMNPGTGGPPIIFGTWSIPTGTTTADFAYDPVGAGAPYHYAQTVAAGSLADPTVGGTAYQFVFNDVSSTLGGLITGTMAAGDYALSVWLPTGPTQVGGPAGAVLYPSRYLVVTVEAGTTRLWTEVIDTYTAGPGFFQIGTVSTNGTNLLTAPKRLFHYDGTNKLSIKIWNTVPYGTNGILLDTPGTTVVYADAVLAASSTGYYTSSPIVGPIFLRGIAPLQVTRTVAAMNKIVPGQDAATGATTSNVSGVVRSYNYDNGSVAGAPGLPVTHNRGYEWEYSPLDDSQVVVDNGSTNSSRDPGWINSKAEVNYYGDDYFVNSLISAWSARVIYSPVLQDGTYDVYAWIPGDGATVKFGKSVLYRIREGTTVTTVRLDQSVSQGWVRLGTRRFTHASLTPLQVDVTNEGSADDVANGRKGYADAIRFVGSSNLAIEATPAMATVKIRRPKDNKVGNPIVTEDVSVVIVAAENGRIYCLDAQGNTNNLNQGTLTDGSTTVYWTYPSTPDVNNPGWTDPNNVNGLDGVGGQAEMPIGFGRTSPLIQRINGKDYVFIGSKNGRTYCIDVEGRGDMDIKNRKPGTTTRVWSYPADYPQVPAKPSLPGQVTGSVAYAEVSPNKHRIFIPSTEGRLFCVDAVGNGNKTTSLSWAYPTLTQSNLGAIEAAPTLHRSTIGLNLRVYFGTDVKAGASSAGFYCVDADTGALIWSRNTGTKLFDNFGTCGAAAAPASQLGTPAQVDTIFAANANLYLYAFNADNGNILWETDELRTPVFGSLSYSFLNVFKPGTVSLAQPKGNYPCVIVPTSDGRFSALYANVANVNQFGGRRAWEYVSASDSMDSSVAVGGDPLALDGIFLYGADNNGYIYAFNNAGTSGMPIGMGDAPGQEVVVENDPAGESYRQLKVKFITKAAYEKLRAGTMTYSQAMAGAATVARDAFEWGETVFVLAYDFPYRDKNKNGDPIQPPNVTFQFSVDGVSNRSLTVQSRLFGPDPSMIDDPLDGGKLDGYAIQSFSIQGAGNNAMPPGPAEVSASVSTGALLSGVPVQIRQVIAANPALARRIFNIANPLAIVTAFTANGAADPNRSIGNTTDPTNAEALQNGSPDIAGTSKNEALLTLPFANLTHGQTGTNSMAVIDRSLMVLQRGPGRGLDNVRLSRSNLAWQGGSTRVVKPINNSLYPNMEDLPVQFPNVSLDYPDVRIDAIRATKDPYGNAENPIYGGVTLIAPHGVGGTNAAVDPNSPLSRIMTLTPLDVMLDILKYQPPNNSTTTDSGGASVPAGYYGNFSVFVDTNNNGRLDLASRTREAYRSFWIGATVAPDERLSIGTPLVDLGSLPTGAGFSPLAPWNASSTFSPWSGPFQTIFQPFTAYNEGNVNLLNVRLAKTTNVGNSFTPWPIYAASNHESAWLDSEWDLWSDLDPKFQVGGVPPIVKKSRPGDVAPTRMTTNPIRRDNANLGVVQGQVFGSPTPADPRVAVTIPIGFPIGTYQQIMRVIEDADGNLSLALDASGNGLETYSDPTFQLKFTVREARITNTYTKYTAPILDNLVPRDVNDNPVALPFMHQNYTPAAIRSTNGSMAIVFSSTRNPVIDTAEPTQVQGAQDLTKLFMVSLKGIAPSANAGKSPLADLNNWTPANSGRWVGREISRFPFDAVDTLFGSANGESVVATSVRFFAPSFPTSGFTDPSTGSALPRAPLAFVGTAQKQTPIGLIRETRLFLTTVALASNAGVTLGSTIPMPLDPLMPKGKPAVVQVGNNVHLFFGGTVNGLRTLFTTAYVNGRWGGFDRGGFRTDWLAPISLGTGFEYADSPSVSVRNYASTVQFSNGQTLAEMLFVGKLRDRSNSDVFFSRMRLNGGGGWDLVDLPTVSRERLVVTGDSSTYRSQGVQWNINSGITLQMILNGVTTNLEVAGTRVIDRTTGLLSFTTTLGGTCYVDTTLGTIRFARSFPARGATLLLSYRPRFLRVSGQAAAIYANPTLVWDNRLIGEFSYWARPGNPPTAINPNTDAVRTGRYSFFYERGASGQGQSARPYLQTVRYGIQLINPATGELVQIHTQSNGSITQMSVSGATSFMQVDPANGRIYFTPADEDRVVTVSFAGVDPATGQRVAIASAQYTVGLITERTEEPVPIEQSVNEGMLTAFIDPFDPAAVAQRRPNLIWMFWTSTRGGASDIFFQTIAPRYTPLANRR